MEQKSILEGISEHDVVTVQNPFNERFPAYVARSVVVKSNPQGSQPTGNATADSFMQGIQRGIQAGGHTSRQHVQQTIWFEPNQIMRLPGDVAKVIVNQMVREYLQRQSRKVKTDRKLKTNAILIADHVTYMETEKLIVKNSESMLHNISAETAEQRLQRQLDELNQTPESGSTEVIDEQPFPTENGGGATGSEEAAAIPRRGRPPKAAKR